MSIKAYLFDLDGTLANSERFYVDTIKKCLLENGFIGDTSNFDEELAGLDDEKEQLFISKSLNISFNDAKKLYEKFFRENVIDYRYFIFPDALETITKLKVMGYKLAICSNNTEENVQQFLSCGFEEMFDCELNIENSNCKSKPEPDMFLLAMKRLNVKPEECVVVEDSSLGVEAGLRSGAYVVATRESGFKVDLSKAHKIINNLIELIRE